MSNSYLKSIAVASACLFSLSVFAAPVNINSADVETLSSALKGVGLKKAEAIIEYRKQNGDFTSAMDLSLVKGIGEKTVLKNQHDIALTAEELAEKLSQEAG